MESTILSVGRRSSRLLLVLAGLFVLLMLFAIATPNLLRSRMAPPTADVTRQYSRAYSGPRMAKEIAAEPAAEGGLVDSGSAEVAELDRKVVRNGTLAMIVDDPAGTLDEINALARRHQGYVVTSELTGAQQNQRGSITIRVPAGQFDEARLEVKKLAKHVDSEQTSSDDVTLQFAENEATLRNFRAEETSYQQIMQRSGAIRDTVMVAQQLANVRGRIERLEAQIRTMSTQTAMAAIQISVGMEPIAVPPQRWSPLYELRAAWNEGISALTNYATAMMSLLLYLPAVLAWIVTILAGAKLVWMLLRFGYRLFVPKQQASAA